MHYFLKFNTNFTIVLGIEVWASLDSQQSYGNMSNYNQTVNVQLSICVAQAQWGPVAAGPLCL